jgi:DNA-binding LacI/PurR family transcriptional regulator
MDDPIVKDTLAGFDATCISLGAMDPTPHMVRTVRLSRKPVVFFDANLSEQGFPSIWLASPMAVTALLEHLAELGHRRIACLNTQPHNRVTEMRLKAWREWTEPRGLAGLLIDQPVDPFESPVERAYRVTREAIASQRLGDTALLCCTSAAAKGVYRAFHECGVRVGADIAVCSADDGAGEAPYFVPSLTSIQDRDPEPYLSVCMDWFATGGRAWKGPLLVQPAKAPIFIGESTQA